MAAASSILRTTGLDRGAARVVLLCGHGSHHVNNLHRAALDCGACGGRSGAGNARAAAALLNDADVRAGLAAAPDAQAALVVLGDLPWLDPVAVERVAAAGRSGVAAARATDGGRPGHPVWIGSALIDAARAAPDEGLRSLLAAAPTEPVTCDGLGVCDDVDRTADLPH